MIKTSVRLVEKPEPGSSPEHDCNRRPAALAGRQLDDRRAREPAGKAQTPHGARGPPGRLGATDAGCSQGEAKVLLDRELLVQKRRMSQVADLSAHLSSIDGEVVTEDDRLSRAQRQQATAEPQQAALPGAVRAGEVDDLAFADLERHSSEERESIGEGDGLTKMNGGRHGIAQC